MNRLLVTLFCALVLGFGASAQSSGWMVGLDFEESNYESKYVDGLTARGSHIAHAFKISGAYNFALPVKGLFVRPKANINIRWGHHAPADGLFSDDSYQSLGAGLNVFAGYRIFKYLEFFTGPTVDWFFYNHFDEPEHMEIDDGATYSYWTFGAGIPLGRFTVEGTFKLHMNTPDVDIQRNRWSVGVSYRF